MTLSKRLAFLTVSASALFAAAPAFADMDAKSNHHSIYFRGAIGLQQLQGQDYDINAGELRNTYDKAPAYIGAVGYDFGDYDLELEYSHRKNTVDGETLQGSKLLAVGGDTVSSAVMVNAYYETPTDGRWQPIIGVGLGTAQVDMNQHSTSGLLLLDDGNRVAAYQGMLGMQYNFTDKISGFAEYRYFATATVPVTTKTNTRHEVAYEDHNISLGIKYSFK